MGLGNAAIKAKEIKLFAYQGFIKYFNFCFIPLTEYAVSLCVQGQQFEVKQNILNTKLSLQNFYKIVCIKNLHYCPYISTFSSDLFIEK